MAWTLIGAAIGLGTAAYGASQQSKQIRKANAATATANAAQRKVQQASVDASKASAAAEALRQQQMRLEGVRARRQILRNANAGQAISVARSVAQTGTTNSSSAQAGKQSVATQGRIDVLANLQNIMIGEGIFGQNQKIFEANSRGAQAQTVANIASSQSAQYQNNASYYQQYVSAGMNIAGQSAAIGRVAENTYGSVFGSGSSNPNWLPVVTDQYNSVIWNPLK